jgi:hypothetical protein
MQNSPRPHPNNIYGLAPGQASGERGVAGGPRRIPIEQRPSSATLAGDSWAHAENEKFETGDYDLVELAARRQLLALRGRWSWWLIVWITAVSRFAVRQAAVFALSQSRDGPDR